MPRNSNSQRERNREGGAVNPPAENESVMTKIWKFLMDRGQVEKYLVPVLQILGRIWVVFKILELVLPDAYSTHETRTFFWFVINGMAIIVLPLALVILILTFLWRRDQ